MVKLIRSDLEFILQQILIAEAHSAGLSLASQLPNAVVPFGLRTVTGEFNNLFPGQSHFGAADTLFPRMLSASFLNDSDGDSIDFDGPGGAPAFVQGDYGLAGSVVDADPRTISNLIVDQSAGINPATGRVNNMSAYATAYDPGADGVYGFGNVLSPANADDVLKPGVSIIDGVRADGTPFQTFEFANTTPDEGLSAPFNAWMTFFGQFFDHGLDLVTKGDNGKIYIPLSEDDPLYVPGGFSNFMVVTRAKVFGTETENTTSPFVDQNQTYSSHPSHQVFLRAYAFNGAGDPVSTGKLIEGANGGMANWAEVKEQARTMLGIQLTDMDVFNVPLLRTDAYGKFIPGANGFPQVITGAGTDGIFNTSDDTVIEGDPSANGGLGISLATAVRTGHAFLNDIAHNAEPGTVFDPDGPGGLGVQAVEADGDNVAGNTIGVDFMGRKVAYDDELLDAHFMAGDGRVNENIGLTAVHAVFHSEHNRLVEHTKDVALESAQAILAEQLANGATAAVAQAAAVAFLNPWLIVPVTSLTGVTTANVTWNGERLFQTAKLGTEMQYQHLVFEEFARKVQPMVDVFLAPEGFDTAINPAIVAEFAHTVYRFGHSMLTETVDRFDADFSRVNSDDPGANDAAQIGLIQAFLNPLEYVASGATNEQTIGNLVRGLTRTQGNEIDEFVTEALRNNLVGLPLDLPAINIARGRDTGIPSLNAARREFYAMTSDSQLKPYSSWADFAAHLRHPESLMNFIAAYGTHASIVAATTLADKRAAAYALVYGAEGMDGDILTLEDNTDTLFPGVPVPADRLDFLHAQGIYAPDGAGGNDDSLGGLDNVDLWIGGLAERQMPFGGLLGSTFNFVFETQLENLQNSDRFYYLARLAGLNLLNEMENNSFSKLIMRNSDAVHLPAEVFTTPAFTLEVNSAAQFTGIGINGRDDPTDGGTELRPLVIRDNPANGAGIDANYLEYTGVDHVVLGGTAGNDIMIASIGDDTIWGDGGNDRIEGGDGVDNVEAGSGDDIITDKGGDDVLKGNDGNDVISAGNGFNLILGGAGSDFIITGEDVSETFAGEGNDFILGAQMNLPTFGNEGDDWIEIGTSDGAGGDNFDPQEASTVIGHDVFITGGGFDEADGEGGDDIMVFSDGEDHFGGGGGFDWASYANDTLGVTADLLVNDLIEPPVTPSNQGIRDRFAEVEGLSGSKFSDVLRGDNAGLADIATTDALNGELTRISLIRNLQTLLGDGVTRFSTGNIILGGDGSDIIEGRGGDDLIDGDRSLNVRIAVYAANDPNHTGAEIASFQTMQDPTLLLNMLNGVWNPTQLNIVREILTANGPDFDTAVYSDIMANYLIETVGDVTTVTHRVPDGLGGFVLGAIGIDGVDRLTNIERLQFSPDLTAPAGTPEATGTFLIVPDLNTEPEGVLVIDAGLDGIPSVGETLTASAAGIVEGDNPDGTITGGAVNYVWQAERIPGSGIFTDIVTIGGAQPETAIGNTLEVTADLDGLALRVKAIYQDALGTLETVYSAPTAPVAGGAAPPAPPAPPAETIVDSPGNGLHLIRADLQFILDQIKIAENHSGAYGTPSQDILSQIANSRLPFGLRTVDGTYNNLVQGQTDFGAADRDFVLQLDQIFRDDQDGDSFDTNGPAPGGNVTNTDYASTTNVADADPRIISNLISDQTAANLAAAIANGDADAVMSPGLDGIFGTTDDREVFFIPNTTPDEGLSAQFNSWFTFFGQFFDHGLDLVDKGGNGTVYIPLMPDDPLIAGANGIFGDGDDLPVQQRFMAVTRATNSSVSPGADLVFGTADDVHLHNNETTPFVDQNQTYTSHASHQVYLREYELNGAGNPVSTGRLIDGMVGGGIANWGEVKAQTANLLGLRMNDMDVLDAPLLVTDAYGKFIPGANGFAQVVVNIAIVNSATGAVISTVPGTFTVEGADSDPDDGLAGRDLHSIEADEVPGFTPAVLPGGQEYRVAPVGTGHAFLNDIAHNATPGTVFDLDGIPGGALGVVQADADNVAGNAIATDFAGRKVAYDDELLDAHFITGDGRGNENIGLTSVHFIFHAEHNRMVEHLKDVAIASNDVGFLNEWLSTPVLALPVTQPEIDALQWNGERIFQAARFSTEMQYQHLVFEEFARKVQPQVDVFLMEGQGYDSTINPAIVAEFAHVVYRFGHSMLTETVDRFDPNFNVIGNPNGLDPAGQQMGLIAAFLNPLAFVQTVSGVATMTAAEGAAAVIRGTTRQAGNEIDEFVTVALRDNLVGLPLDLPAINIARGRDTGVPTLNEARKEFYAMTGDSQLKPYTSWVDFAANIKHVESLVNFVAAYGTHTSITSQSTVVGKREAAYALVYGAGGMDGVVADDPGTPTHDESADNPVVPVPADRMDFLYGRGAYATNLGGLNDIDLWIGGLAEKQMPFGGLLGSTFNFVFETQMEKLQNGDRFYYLERTAGLNFLTELENNSFAKLIMANTDLKHLPGDVFSTPAWILEVNQADQFTGLGLDNRADPTEGGTALNPLVQRDDPNTAVVESNYLKYTGVDHVVLGGTEGNDTLISSIGDDTLYGDGGNDRLEGGDGVDMLLGGAGDDIITDRGGDDNIQGQDGHDAIHGGNGINLILAGFGNDFVVIGEDESEAFGGGGNDYILGIKPVEMIFGNEGDDWIEHGMADGSAGENFDTRGLDSIIGHDVFMGDTVADRMFGEGGDDIMVGNGGRGDRYLGASGFDWANYQHPTLAAEADLNLRAFDETPVPLSPSSVLSRFESIEGVSGSQFGDILRGDDLDAAGIASSGFTGSVMNQAGINLIDGMQALLDGMLGGPTTSFGAGNIMLGGDGSDVLEGRGGNDLIEGDLALNVRISVRSGVTANGPTGGEIATTNSMTGILENKSGALAGTPANLTLSDAIFQGLINPGQLQIVREILAPTNGDPDFDTAVFSQPLFDVANGVFNYEIRVNGVLRDLGPGPIANFGPLIPANAVVTVTDIGGLTDGTDTLRHIERLQFADQSLTIFAANNPAAGNPLVAGVATEDGLLTVSIGNVTDIDNIDLLTNPTGAVTEPVTYFWQVELRPGDGVFTDIVRATGFGDVHATGATFIPGDDEVGLRLRVRMVYQDANGVIEEAYSAPTAAVANINDAPTGLPGLSDLSPTEGVEIIAVTTAIADVDGLTTPNFQYQWQLSLDGGASWNDIIGEVGPGYTPVQTDVGFMVRVRVQFTDDGGQLEELFSAPSTPIGDLIQGDGAGNALAGTAFDDFILGLGGNDNLTGNAGNDILDGGADLDLLVGGAGNDTLLGGTGADTLSGGDDNDTLNGGAGTDNVSGDAGDDTIVYTTGDGADIVDGGTGIDTLNVSGTAGNDTIAVTYNGTVLTVIAGGAVSNVERVNANLLAGVDTLSYAATAAAIAVAVNLAAGTGSGFTSILGVENLVGGSGNDSLTGNGQANTITGGRGNDTVNGGLGDDLLLASVPVGSPTDGNDAYIGGSGFDTYSLAATNAGATVNLVTGTSSSGITGSDTLSGIEGVTGSGAGDNITGDGAANVLSGGGGADFLSGGGGNDVLIGGGGADTILGGAGNDTILYTFGDGADPSYDGGADTDTLQITGTGGNNTLTVVYDGTRYTQFSTGGAATTLTGIEVLTANLGAGTDRISFAGTAAAVGVSVNLSTSSATGFAAGSLTNVENVTGGSGSDTIVGTDTNNDLNGGANGGSDSISGLGGNDTLTGGGGNDVLTGGGGNDAITGGAGDDVINYTFGDGNDPTIDGGADNDTLNISGSAANNTLTVAYNGAVLTNFNGGGIAGIETVNADLLGGVDTLSYGASAAGISANVAAGAASGFANLAGAENLTGGTGNDTLVGDGGDNTLNGGAGNGADTLDGAGGADTLTGGAGADILTGGLGDDAMNGGADNDVFVFGVGFGNDTITGFDENPVGGQDLLDISALGVTSGDFDSRVNILQVGATVQISVDGQTITLIGENAANYNSTDFLLAP